MKLFHVMMNFGDGTFKMLPPLEAEDEEGAIRAAEDYINDSVWFDIVSGDA